MSSKENTELKKAIRAKCIDCSGGSVKEVALCPVDDCPLYRYRLAAIQHPAPQTERKPVTLPGD